MNTFKNLFFFVLVAGFFTFTSCGDDDVEVPNEEEVITTLNFILTSAAGDAVTMKFLDLDGDGGNDPVITNGTLKANTAYTGAVTLLNEAESPAENITEEVQEEDAEHQFFYSTSLSDLTVVYTDMDADGNPVGLSTTVTTGAAGTGTLKVTLKHEPAKSAEGVSGGDITNAGGETDIEVVFDVTVEE